MARPPQKRSPADEDTRNVGERGKCAEKKSGAAQIYAQRELAFGADERSSRALLNTCSRCSLTRYSLSCSLTRYSLSDALFAVCHLTTSPAEAMTDKVCACPYFTPPTR